ncbi:hypothetical protein [Methylomicrobium lacus]|uniref:hypothetical protein n=1 Tax=Methylomicrobium lacus TaxID=136992 RepID=UPI0035A8F6DE
MSNACEKNTPEQDDEIIRDKERITVALSTSETVARYGNANAEYIKGYTGIDNETGQRFAKGLKDISEGKVHPDYAERNIKQQAGFSAEVATTSRDNSEAIINGSKIRTTRSDDLPQYGKNHNIVDRVQILDGNIIEGSQSQMKFVGDRNALFKKIAEDTQNGDGEFARYRGIKLELPSEQYGDAAEYCRKKAQELRDQAEMAAGKDAPPEVVERLRRNADNYDQLAENVFDSGLTTEDAIFYREHPKMATALDIARTSHRAGVEGAKYGAVIGGAISLLTNAFSVAQEKKQFSEAALDVTTDIAKAGALGYGTAFVGSTIKSGLQQSSNQTLRVLAGTNAPALAVNICLSLGNSVKRYVTGEISEAQLLSEVGEKGAGMLSSSMMAALGQLAIPVPFVGAAIGGMIGYTLSSFFYQSALDAARGVELSRQQLERIRAIEAAARDRIAAEQAALDAFTRREIPQLRQETECLFAVVSNGASHVDDLAAAINEYATLLGKKLQFQSMSEFEDFMDSDQPLAL